MCSVLGDSVAYLCFGFGEWVGSRRPSHVARMSCVNSFLGRCRGGGGGGGGQAAPCPHPITRSTGDCVQDTKC